MLWAVDTETTGLNRFKGARPFLYIAYNGKDYICSRNVEDIKPVVENPDNTCVFHNAKFDIHMLRSVGVDVKCKVYDTLIAISLLDGALKDKGLKSLAKRLLGKENTTEQIVTKWFKDNGITRNADRKYIDLPDNIIYPYAKDDVLFTFSLWQLFRPELLTQNLFRLFEKECLLISALVRMEEVGVLIDKEGTHTLSVQIEGSVKVIKEGIASEYGAEFRFNSNLELGKKLQKLGVAMLFTDKGNVMVNKDALKEYNHPLGTLVAKYRKLEKLKTTYCKNLLELIDENDTLHPNFLSWSTITGRFSCNNPNLQNIPKPKADKPDSKWIRALFISREGYTNFYLDYGQIEYRVAVMYFEDQELKDRINDGEDVHTIQAQRIFDVKTPTKEQRSIAKAVNFAVLYGAGTKQLAKTIGKSEEFAKEVSDRFYSENPVINEIKHSIDRKIAGKYRKFGRTIRTPMDFKGYIYNLFNRRYRIRAQESYKGFNYLCQGSAADIIKQAMIDVDSYLLDKKSNLLLNVHDELVIEVANGEEHIIPTIKLLMEEPGCIHGVNMSVDVAYSKTNWADKEIYVIREDI